MISRQSRDSRWNIYALFSWQGESETMIFINILCQNVRFMIRSGRTFGKLGHRKLSLLKIRDVLKEFVQKGVLRLFHFQKSCRKRLTIISFRTLRRCVRKFNFWNVDADLSGTLSAHFPAPSACKSTSSLRSVGTPAWSSLAGCAWGDRKCCERNTIRKNFIRHYCHIRIRQSHEGFVRANLVSRRSLSFPCFR